MATNQELIDYYAKLLVIQYLGKPKAYATIQATVGPIIMDQLPLQVQNAFNMLGTNIAQGVQLDVIGKYAGVTRYSSDFNGNLITLSDADFLSLIKFATVTNSNGSSLSDIQDLMYQFFPGEVFVYDYRDMRISYVINSSVGSQDLIQALVNEGLIPKPMGVQLASIIYVPITDQFFGFRDYYHAAVYANPFNDYSDYQLTWPWLSYNDAAHATTIMTTESGDPLTQENDDLIYV